MEFCAESVKKAAGLGADLCGIASFDRFGEAPEGYRPQDVLPGCRSVVVNAIRSLDSTLIPISFPLPEIYVAGSLAGTGTAVAPCDSSAAASSRPIWSRRRYAWFRIVESGIRVEADITVTRT